MTTREVHEGRDWEWATSISTLSPAPETLRLEISEFSEEPFSNKFADLFDDLGFHIESEADDNTTAIIEQSTRYDIENFSNMNEIAPGWRRYPEIEEIIILSSKKRALKGLPTILEDRGESHCSIAPMAALSDFEFDFDAFDKPSSSGNTKNATVCVRRDNGIQYIIKRKRAARNASWSEQAILETLTDLGTSFVSRVYWSFYSGEHIYLVTDYLPENDFTDLIQEHGPLGIHHATLYASELVVAVSSLHAAGIMHRDIQPRNIKLDTKGHIILVNFGLAEFTREAVHDTQRTAVPSDMDYTSTVYRAPELLLGWNHDAAVDCWSFGMLLYYMVFGMHPFGGRHGIQDDYAWVYDQIIRSSIPTESLRLVHPMARDLILKCLERNPAMRLNMEQIKTHSYFDSVDWKKVAAMEIDVPSLQTTPVTPANPSFTAIHDTHQRYSSHNTPLLDRDTLKRISTYECAQSIENLCTGISELPREEPSTLTQLFAPLTLNRVEGPAVPKSFKPLARVMDVNEEGNRLLLPDDSGHEPEIIREPRSQDAKTDRISQFWDDLDQEQDTSGASINSLEFGATTGVPYQKAPKLRKYRSAIQSRSRLFNVSTVSFQSRLHKKPRSTGALRQTRPLEVYENLPIGVHQIGSGIGFKYNVPAAVLSKGSVVSFAPPCHLFQRGFSVRSLGLSLGGSSAGAKKSKHVVPCASASVLPPNETAPPAPPVTSPQPSQAKDAGNGAFIREMYQSPTWILSPPDSLPSPLVLVNSPASSGSGSGSGSEPLSPATLVDGGTDEDEEGHDHVNIIIPKSLEIEIGLPLSGWAPTSTLRLVPPSPATCEVPCLDSGDDSFSTDTTG